MEGATPNGRETDPVRGQSYGAADHAPAGFHAVTADLHDQVSRKLAYLCTHPDVGIIAPCSHEPMWRAKLSGGAVEIKALELRLLLDQLEKLD